MTTLLYILLILTLGFVGGVGFTIYVAYWYFAHKVEPQLTEAERVIDETLNAMHLQDAHAQYLQNALNDGEDVVTIFDIGNLNCTGLPADMLDPAGLFGPLPPLLYGPPFVPNVLFDGETALPDPEPVVMPPSPYQDVIGDEHFQNLMSKLWETQVKDDECDGA